ncbi:cytochrome d ubiquinol oxidase subunit II [Tessaracoccus lapidicaptus]|uniref:Cytochrome d ubiquinol oxidase subunit II n=1 Tax=Tessaracoccus lapidicaptus TaxID=1427523 RepID=A0A1C0AKY2_9ACTN|nr:MULTISPECIES: cytochrome d ubiquinol oxidase subunit II [Tessaracoccus]AQX16046.1 cytochrome d ubiquinol oxidase subunit II [Tessaracoccus sp. T2.5-30]OCL33347.1 cytochrome d ubiquinol oxidase subunit II [Tessaracoccus lapidicaptus]VEP40574.1 Cytochrome bd-I ubiquinol oxidase subunit 2 [Tessaracoccus lapidicaptus]
MNILLETVSVPTLPMVWFLLVAVLWLGFFFLEGFDFGVAMLIPVLGKNDRDRRVVVNTIGPVWDGNEVWLLTAGGAMFAAFPGWYASLFSGLYLPLLLVLVGLILRGVAFEYRSKHPGTRFRAMLDWFAIVGSFLPSLVFGVGFANFVIGLANDGLLWNGSFWGLFGPFALLGGVMLVVLFLVHGSAFIALKTKGHIHERAEAFGGRVGFGAAVLVALYVISQNVFYPATSEFGDFSLAAWAAGIVAILAIVGATLMIRKGRDGWGFILTGTTVLTLFIGMFLRMYGNLGFAQDESRPVEERLNIITAASSDTTLTIMTWAAVIFVPIVLAYQSWSYWVFSRRISTKNIPEEVSAVA